MTGKTKSVIQPKNDEIILKIKKPKGGTIFGWASLFIFIYFIVYVVANANAQGNGLSTRDLLQPLKWFSSEVEKVETSIPTPTLEITLTPTPKPKIYADPDPIIDCKFTYIGTIKLKRSVCNKSTDCQIGNKWIYYDSVDNCKADQNAYNQQQKNPNTNNTKISDEEYKKQSAEIKISCSFSNGEYVFDYGMLTYDECKIKTDAYWASKKVIIPTIPPLPIAVIVPGKSQADIDKCKSEVKAKYDDLIRGCYIQYQGSASNMCANGYQELSSNEMKNCE